MSKLGATVLLVDRLKSLGMTPDELLSHEEDILLKGSVVVQITKNGSRVFDVFPPETNLSQAIDDIVPFL